MNPPKLKKNTSVETNPNRTPKSWPPSPSESNGTLFRRVASLGTISSAAMMDVRTRLRRAKY